MDMAPVPPLAPILIVVWLAALWTAVTKFNLMDITPSMISGSFLKNFDIYQTLIENFTDIIWTMDRSMKLTFISESVRSLLGYTPEEMMELSFDRYVTPASFKISTRMLAEEFEREGKTGVPPDRTGRADVEYIRKDGTTMWAEIHVRFIRFDDKITGIMGISRDVSKRRETEDKLRLSEEKYRQLVEHAGDIIYQTDTGGAFTYINPNVEKAVGYPMDKLIGVVFTEFMPEKYRDTMMKFYAKQYHTRTIETSHEVPMQTSDGRIVWFEQNVRLLLEGDSVIGFQGIARDITDRKSMEDQLRQRNDIIEHDLTNAQFIQQALLPAVPPQWHPVKTSFRFQPMEKIGGDFFSFTTYQEGGLGVFIGDVSGHGVSAALYLSLLKANTDRACRSHGLHPGALLTSLNKELASSMPNGFVTAIYGLFQTDPETGIPGFTFACGGHPLPVLQRKGGKTAELTGIHGPVLGSFKGRDYFETIASLRQGDRLYLYTDGIPEARNSREEIIGFDELPGIISSLSKDDLDESLDAVIDYCRKFRGAENQDDDIVLIGFEVL
jgi:PAS domain S-box-containing protein